MNKSKINLIIDAIMFIAMMAIAGIGFLIKYVLIPGFKRNEIYGKDVELFYWGLDRHQWGSIHLILGFILLFLLLLHIVLHWEMIKCIYRRMITNRVTRTSLTISLVVLSIVLGIGPLFIRPTAINTRPQYHRYDKSERNYNLNMEAGNSTSSSKTVSKKQQATGVVSDSITKKPVDDQPTNYQGSHHKIHKLSEVEVYGYETLNEIAKKYNIPVTELAAAVKIPVEDANQKLGRLRKQYNFHMDDLREFIKNHEN